MKASNGKHRDPAKEQLWRRVIADHARSGVSIRAHCQREGLNPWNFQWWRRELARRDRQVASTPTRTRPELNTEPARSSAFLPVQVVEDDPAPMTQASAIEILFPVGPIVRVNRDFDPLVLDAVLSVLEARRC
jgi:transposase-like protein